MFGNKQYQERSRPFQMRCASTIGPAPVSSRVYWEVECGSILGVRILTLGTGDFGLLIRMKSNYGSTKEKPKGKLHFTKIVLQNY